MNKSREEIKDCVQLMSLETMLKKRQKEKKLKCDLYEKQYLPGRFFRNEERRKGSEEDVADSCSLL